MGKKIVKICVLLILISIFAFVGIVSVVVYDTVRTHISQIELNKISQQEKEELIKLDFLELTEYPSSLEFLQLRQESEIRETQYYIEFSIDKKEVELYEIEKNSNRSPNEITILKKYEDNEKNIYELQTNFAQNSKEEKWKYLYDLIEKYKER
jgi:hypothetical protein